MSPVEARKELAIIRPLRAYLEQREQKLIKVLEESAPAEKKRWEEGTQSP